MLTLLLVAFSLGLSNFAGAITIGLSGVTARRRLEVGVVFGVFEAGMPVLGLALGRGLAHDFGHATNWVGGGLLMATGGYSVFQGLGSPDTGDSPITADNQRGRLLLTGLALSIDNLAVGFALGTYRVTLAVAAVVIGAVSVTMALIGLEVGARIGTRIGERGELLGGLILMALGVAIAAGAL